MTVKYNRLFHFSLSLATPHHHHHQELPDDIRANLTEELPQPREIPRKLSEYTQEEIDAFPRLWTPYAEHTQTRAESVNRGSMQAWLSMKHNCTGGCEHTIVVCTHKHRIIRNAEFHTVQQRDAETIPDVPLVSVERGQHVHPGGHAQPCLFRGLQRHCVQTIPSNNHQVYSYCCFMSRTQMNHGFVVYTLQTGHTHLHSDTRWIKTYVRPSYMQFLSRFWCFDHVAWSWACSDVLQPDGGDVTLLLMWLWCMLWQLSHTNIHTSTY